MIVVFLAYGNHSNRLFQSLLLDAFCLEHRVVFFNPTLSDLGLPLGWNRFLLAPAICRFLRWLDKRNLLRCVDLLAIAEPEAYYEALLKRRVCFVKGWSFHSSDLVDKHRQVLRKKYSVEPRHYVANALFRQLQQWSTDGDPVVGVHIRRGDYRTWKDGRYFYGDEVYRRIMDELSEELHVLTGRAPRFILFSNEETSFLPTEVVSISKNEWWMDQVLMSHCDYLIGPPSTFTSWASFLGAVPFLHIESQDESFAIDRFHALFPR